MRVTLTAVTAAVGGHVGAGGATEALLDAATTRLTSPAVDGLLIEGRAFLLGGELLLVLTHEREENNGDVHGAAWEAIAAAAAVARERQLHAAGSDLVTDAFSGTLSGAGPSVAELTFEERASEPVLVLAAPGTATGAFNLPLFKAFADPFNTAGLVLSESLHEGCSFEVHDAVARRKAMFNTPDEAYDLLAYIGMPGRFAVKRVVPRSTGEVAATASTDRLAEIAGGHAGIESPVAVVRCEGELPTVGEALEPFAMPALVQGFARGGHLGPWMPSTIDAASAGRFDGPPRVVALGFQLAGGRLGARRDLFADPSWDRARDEANRIADALRALGPFEPHRMPLDELELQELPGAMARTESRWVDA